MNDASCVCIHLINGAVDSTSSSSCTHPSPAGDLHGSYCRVWSLPGAEPWSSERDRSDTRGGELCFLPGNRRRRESKSHHLLVFTRVSVLLSHILL